MYLVHLHSMDGIMVSFPMFLPIISRHKSTLFIAKMIVSDKLFSQKLSIPVTSPVNSFVSGQISRLSPIEIVCSIVVTVGLGSTLIYNKVVSQLPKSLHKTKQLVSCPR